MSLVVPVPLVSLCSPDHLRVMVCGEADIDLGLLRSVAVYKGGFTADSDVVKWFWQALEEFTPAERSLFVRFAWGRRFDADFYCCCCCFVSQLVFIV